MVFVFGEDIIAPHFFFFDYGEDKTAAQKKFFALREDTTGRKSFFAHTAKTKKRTPFFFFAFGEFNAAASVGMLRPQNSMLRQAAHGLWRLLREMAISTQMLRQRNSATAN